MHILLYSRQVLLSSLAKKLKSEFFYSDFQHVAIFLHINRYTHTFIHKFTHTHSHIYTYTDTETHTYIDTHSHIYIHSMKHKEGKREDLKSQEKILEVRNEVKRGREYKTREKQGSVRTARMDTNSISERDAVGTHNTISAEVFRSPERWAPSQYKVLCALSL